MVIRDSGKELELQRIFLNTEWYGAALSTFLMAA
jgi:hypothetical protein